jgi:hypothetical protein
VSFDIRRDPDTDETRDKTIEMGAKDILERVALLKQEMRDLQIVNARLDEPQSSKESYESRIARLHQIKLDLAEMLYAFKREGAH